MFAVIKTGGKQYRVAAGDTIAVEKLAGEPGDVVAFEQVLMLVDGDTTQVGAPAVAGVTVAGELVEQTRGAKVIAFKKRRRKNSRRKRGHRQHLSVVRITDVLTGGAKPATKARKAAPEAKAAPAPAGDDHHAHIAAGASAAVEAARAKGIDTARFQHLPEPVGKADDLKLISGVGPTIEKKLNAAGVWHYWQVKGLSEEDIEKVEHEVGFKGRAHRDDWMGQAADLMAGKGPRPKTHDHHEDEH